MKILFGCIVYLFISLPVMAEKLQVSLEEFTAAPMLTLKCVSDRKGIEIPISERWNIKKVSLNFHYVSSINLIGDISQLVVKINGFPITQVKLDPLKPEAMIKLNVPKQYLKPGYNRLDFQVAQHYLTDECENPCAPDLWTSISMRDSYMQIEYTANPVPLKLSSITSFLFDPKIYPEAKVNIITEDQSAESLTLASIISSGIARRFDYRKVTLSVSRKIQPGMDNIVVGRQAFMRQFVAPFNYSLGHMAGGYLKIFPLPTVNGLDDTHALLAVSGHESDHVKMAALTFANLSFPYPGSQQLNAFEFNMPQIPLYGGRAVLLADKTYDFKTLNFPSTTFRGINPVGKEINFRLPADFLIQQNRSAKLALNFAYGAGMREDSAVNVIVNDKVVWAVGLDKKEGGFLNKYTIDIPLYLFKPGNNVISFGVELHPELKECDIALTGNLFLSIFENSTLTFPSMSHRVELPRLELFMLNAFPFTRWPDGHGSIIYLTDVSDKSISSAMNLVSLMTQKNGFPLLNMPITLELPDNWQGDIFVIGHLSSLPAEFGQQSPLRIGKTTRVAYPANHGWESEFSLAHIHQTSSLGDGKGLLMQFESPYQKGKTVMTISAEKDEDLLGLSQVLFNHEVESQIFGDIALIEMSRPEPIVSSLEVGAKYLTGKNGEVSEIDSFLHSHPYIYYILFGTLILGLTYTIYGLLKRYRAVRKLE
ncbi:MAG: hypothetical protein NMNS01_17840 [Nitrosomonas sp.]|nr:MAG: hypothetical protein NMNS01_17840 [Nitrosomonas sp.]